MTRSRSINSSITLLFLLALEVHGAWVTPNNNNNNKSCRFSPLTLTTTKAAATISSTSPSTSTTLSMNMFSDLGDFMTGGKLVAQAGRLPYGDSLESSSSSSSSSGEQRTLAIQERAISFTGEDFDIVNAEDNAPFCNVRGAMLHLPGKDKMKMISGDGTNDVLATLDRKLLAMTPTYDILRGDSGEKIGWIEKAKIALTDTFEVHAEQAGGFGPFKPPAAYKLEGDFLDRRFVMKNEKGEVVAKVTKDQLVEFDAFNHYQVQVAPGMDAILVLACACAIDEEFDEEHKKRKEQEQ